MSVPQPPPTHSPSLQQMTGLLLPLVAGVGAGVLLLILGVCSWYYNCYKARTYEVIPDTEAPKSSSGALFVSDLPRNRAEINLDVVFNDSSIPQIPEIEIELGEKISSGSFATVFRGLHRPTKKLVAVKKAPGSLANMREREIRDFAMEIKLLAALRHPNVIKIHGITVTHKNELWLILEYMAKGTILDVLHCSERKVSLSEKLRLAVEAAKGLRYLHAQHPPVIHRDIKPSNVLIGEDYSCKIGDFGISALKVSRTMTATGTPVYMAPEIIQRKRYTEKADVYSFGVLLNELYTETIPYTNTEYGRMSFDKVMYAVAHRGLRPYIDPSTPEGLQKLIKECFDADPSKRPTFYDIVPRLEALCNEAGAKEQIRSAPVSDALENSENQRDTL